MDALEFIEVCRTINCLGYHDLKKMYGEELAKHFCDKIEDKGFNFIFELDSGNLKTLYNYVLKKIAARTPPQSITFIKES